ncbi:MAG: SDR family oxidoreductase [Rhodospirillales bacterium]|nr:SDR family oxidoreductase [Rhodospirillales bacterium]
MALDLGLKGRKALVTGASKGIGKAIAERLAAEGCDVTLVARSKDEMEGAAEELRRRHGVAVRVYAMDLADGNNPKILAREHPDLDILVNNAGAIPRGTLLDVDEERWRVAFDLKVFGYINMCREFYRSFKGRGRGVIINILGNGGERVDFGYICGAAGNAGLMAFTRALGGGAHKDGIRVVGINPGAIATERLVNLMRHEAEKRHGDPERWQELFAPLPYERAGTPQEIADMAAFLASDLSAYTNGTIITIDGGLCHSGSLL